LLDLQSGDPTFHCGFQIVFGSSVGHGKRGGWPCLMRITLLIHFTSAAMRARKAGSLCCRRLWTAWSRSSRVPMAPPRRASSATLCSSSTRSSRPSRCWWLRARRS
jgi:hypothetical protein